MGNMLVGRNHKTDGGAVYNSTTKSVKLRKRSSDRRGKDQEDESRRVSPPPDGSEGRNSYCKMGKLQPALSSLNAKRFFNHRKKSMLSNLRDEFSGGPYMTFGRLTELGN